MLYENVEFAREWICNIYPPPHYELLVERNIDCIFSILLKKTWLKSG